MNGDILVMRPTELKRLELIKKAIARELTQLEVSEFLDVSQRQVRRIVRRVKEQGNKGVIHQNRGKGNGRRISEAIKAKVLRVYGSRYKDFGATFACEKLAKHEGIRLGRETLRKWIRQEGYESNRRRRRKHRRWRERKEFYGQMIQMDGSHHDWLQGRGPRLVLMGYIDDATSRAFGRFYEYEGTIPAMDSFKRYCLKYGVPQSVYLDCNSAYKLNRRDDWYFRSYGYGTGLSEFERALKELKVEVIHAYSPQAKGRIERLFRTLQDRLVKELRLSHAKSIEQANKVLEGYLIEHNRRYLREPARNANLHRRAPTAEELDNMLCKKKDHPLRKDFTLVHDAKLYQIEEWTSVNTIEVREHVDGRMQMIGRGRSLKFKPIADRPIKKRIRLSQIKIRLPKDMRSKSSWGSFNLKPRNTLSIG
ncbi:MAG: ISNCY family transposase [Legionellales bacterium]